jgi:hypothetical protein
MQTQNPNTDINRRLFHLISARKKPTTLRKFEIKLSIFWIFRATLTLSLLQQIPTVISRLSPGFGFEIAALSA